MKGALSWFAENHVAANLLMFFIFFAGLLTAFTMKLEVFPDVSLDHIRISAEYRGASPAEVEEAVVRRIEENIAGLAGIKRIDSTAQEGYGTVMIEVMKGWDIKTLVDEVKAQVDRITTFPKEMEEPLVREITHRSQAINIAIYGDVPETTLKHLAETIKNDITNLKGITLFERLRILFAWMTPWMTRSQITEKLGSSSSAGITLAELSGVRDGEIHIEISEKTLRRFGLTLGQVADIVRQSSLDLPAGRIKTKGGEILIRTKGRRYFAKDYADIAIITRPDGSKVTLGQIADLKDGFEDVDMTLRFQGKPVAVIQVYRIADQNVMDVVFLVKQYINEIRPSLPHGVEITFFRDRTVILKSRMFLLMKNMLIGLLLVSLLLGVFLNIRLAFWVTLGIPISFLVGFWLMPRFGVSLNMVSLFAFIMVLGIVVDDAIIIGENIFRKQEQGLERMAASKEGVLEMARPVIFAILTTMAAFYPLILSKGSIIGKFIADIPVVVIVVLFGSLIESLLILPAHLSGMKHRENKESHDNELNNGNRLYRKLHDFINGPYRWCVEFFVKWRYATIALGIAVFMLSLGLIKGGWIKFVYLEQVEGNTMTCSLTMPSGTPFHQTAEIAWQVEKAGREILMEEDRKRSPDDPSLLEYSMAMAGVQVGRHSFSAGGNLAQVRFHLLRSEKREGISTSYLAGLWRKRVGVIPGAENVTFKSALFTPGNPIEVHLSLDDHDMLVAATDDLKAELASYPGVFDINDSFIPGKDEMQLKLKPTAKSLGLTLNDLARQVRHAFYGAEALRLQLDQDEVRVMVRYPEQERKSLRSIEEMRIRTSEGFEIPFKQVAEVKQEQGYSTIQRAQRMRVIKVSADVDDKKANADELRRYLTGEFLPILKSNYQGLRYTIEGEGKEQKESMEDVGKGIIIILFVIYALLAIPFKSFAQPIIVMAAIPFGIIGAIIGHLIMGYNLSILSMFGIMGLTGVVVNDSLVLIHAINRLRDQGENPFDAVIQGGMLRFRAIMLTSLTTFAGLSPMIIEQSLQAKFLIPMAISLGFGIMFATLITLILIPCGYMILEDIKESIGNIISRVVR